jgi:uncharacterized phage protein (TIGR01671 family)
MDNMLKFRAWDKRSKNWIHPSLFYIDCSGMCVKKYGIEKHLSIMCKFGDFVIEQYVGLKDKNGKEAFSGDIVKYKDESGTGQIGIIKDYGYLSFYFEAVGGDEEGNQDLQLYPSEFEIIGDIHDNPELIGEPK